MLAADACEAAGLDVVPLSDLSRRRLGTLLLGAAGGNPLDLLAAADPVSFEAAHSTAKLRTCSPPRESPMTLALVTSQSELAVREPDDSD